MKKLLLLIYLLVNRFGFAQQNAFIRDSLDNYVNKAIQDWQIPGVAVLVVKDGKPVVMKGYGVKEAGKPDKVDENTLFMIASNSKAYTGTLLANLEYEKKLSLDDKVTKYLPDFRLYDACATQLCSIKDLLTHRVGLKTFQGDFMYWESKLTRQQVIQKFGMLKPEYEIRNGYGYCNAAFLTAGEIIPKVTGKPWEQELQERILNPLKMNQTLALSVNLPKQKNLATPHTLVGGNLIKMAYPNLDNLASAGSMSSCISDLSHWIIMQLDSGRYEGKRVLPWEVIRKTRDGVNLITNRKSKGGPRDFQAYGLGWFVQDRFGKLLYQHSGGADGFVTQTILVPEENLGVVVLTNTDTNDLYSILAYQIVDSYLTEEYKNWSNASLAGFKKNIEEEAKRIKAEQDTVAMKNKPTLPLAAYAGKYRHPVYGSAEVKVDNEKLRVIFEHHDIFAILEPKGKNDFLCTFSSPILGIHPAPFEVDNGKVKNMTIKVNDFIEYDPYIFEKVSER
jgi:CubicO group peptidase (beta-lactamase class C family)